MEPMRVLIVDDDEEILTLLERSLSTDPLFKVVTASSGQEALNIALHFSYDALISDMVMPGMNGEELLRELKRNRVCPPVVMMMSGITRPMASHIKGDMVFLEKPFAPGKVIAVLRQAYRQLKKG